MLLIEQSDLPPKEYHYTWQRNPDEALDTAEQYLQRQGCTKVVHCLYVSYGVIEHCDVVNQRAREPRYD